MKIINFLNKLKKEKRFILAKPNQEVIGLYIKTSKSDLVFSKASPNINCFEELIFFAYYSQYNLLQSLLFKTVIKSENPSALAILFEKRFNLDNLFILFAKKGRIGKQYYVDFRITKKQVIDFIKNIEGFNRGLYYFIFRLANKKIKPYIVNL